MALFGNKKPSTAEELLKAYEDLSEDERTKFEQSLGDRVDESVGEQEEENHEEDTQTVEDRVDESVGEEEHHDEEEKGEEVEETIAEERPADVVEETADVEAKHEVDEALIARLEAYESRLAKLEEMLGEIADTDEDFGASETPAMEADKNEVDEDERIMQHYYKGAYRR